MSKEVSKNIQSDNIEEPLWRSVPWWQSEPPPAGEPDISELFPDLIQALEDRIQRGLPIEDRKSQKPQLVGKLKNKPLKPAKKTWQPDPSWRDPIFTIATNDVVEEVEQLLENPSPMVRSDFLPFLAYDFRYAYPELQPILNDIARTAYVCDLLGETGEPGEAVTNESAWKFLQDRWGDFGVVILLAYVCGIDDYLTVTPNGLRLTVDSYVREHEATEPFLPLKTLLSYSNGATKRGIWLEISSYEGRGEYWVSSNPLDSFATFPDWEKALEKENLLQVQPIFSFNITVQINEIIQKSKARFRSELQFVLPNSNEPALRAYSRDVNFFQTSGLRCDQIVSLFKILQASKVAYSFSPTE